MIVDRRQVLRLGAGLGALSLLSACDTTSFGLPSLGNLTLPTAKPQASANQSFGTGPVKVALLLPLSGDAGLAATGISMANAAELAIDYLAGLPKASVNITILVKDTGATADGAAQQASAAVAEGVSLILGPLKGEQVAAAGLVARKAGIPLIGFSDNPDAASPGVYLLNVLPESEVHRSLTYAVGQGKKSIAAVFPATDFGQTQRAAFETAISKFGLSARSTFSFSSDAEMRNVIEGVGPQIKLGNVTGLFFPDRATAPQFATYLGRAGVPKTALIIGSADWDGARPRRPQDAQAAIRGAFRRRSQPFGDHRLYRRDSGQRDAPRQGPAALQRCGADQPRRLQRPRWRVQTASQWAQPVCAGDEKSHRGRRCGGRRAQALARKSHQNRISRQAQTTTTAPMIAPSNTASIEMAPASATRWKPMKAPATPTSAEVTPARPPLSVFENQPRR
jgi:hypothetical protein